MSSAVTSHPSSGSAVCLSDVVEAVRPLVVCYLERLGVTSAAAHEAAVQAVAGQCLGVRWGDLSQTAVRILCDEVAVRLGEASDRTEGRVAGSLRSRKAAVAPRSARNRMATARLRFRPAVTARYWIRTLRQSLRRQEPWASLTHRIS